MINCCGRKKNVRIPNISYVELRFVLLQGIFHLTGILIVMGGVVWVKNFLTMAFPQKG
jgi:hypothetical protein